MLRKLSLPLFLKDPFHFYQYIVDCNPWKERADHIKNIVDSMHTEVPFSFYILATYEKFKTFHMFLDRCRLRCHPHVAQHCWATDVDGFFKMEQAQCVMWEETLLGVPLALRSYRHGSSVQGTAFISPWIQFASLPLSTEDVVGNMASDSFLYKIGWR